MSVAKVLRLDEYRHRRLHRLGLARALYRAEPPRAALFEHLVEVAELTGAERTAVLWVDEYGAGAVHVHSVLDLLSDRPRRHFPQEPLEKAWAYGIPGAYDQATDPEVMASGTLSIALGSDGSRGWFLVAEAVARRSEFEPATRERVMFHAGECSANVLHRDLDVVDGDNASDRFPGWPVLEDLDGRESDLPQAAVIERRFHIVRLISSFVAEGLHVSDDRRSEQVARVEAELAEAEGPPDTELEVLKSVLHAYRDAELWTLGDSLVRGGRIAEDLGHVAGALEMHRCAYDVATAICDASLAIEAARMMGRVLRRRARWKEADHWYDVAHQVADRAGLAALAARSLAGLALVKRERGNLPGARAGFEAAATVAETSGDADTLASVYHDLLGLEHMAGNLQLALAHGWTAVRTYSSDDGRTRCLAALAGALKEYGDLQAAEDAYSVVAHASDENYYRVYAYDALAHIAALRGDEPGFEAHAAKCDELGWEMGPHSTKAEILQYRGLCYEALGRDTEARAWLERSIAFAQEHGFSRILFESEKALEVLATKTSHGPEPLSAAPPEVREGLRAMRRELTGVGT